MSNLQSVLGELEDCTAAIFQALESGDAKAAEQAGFQRDALLRDVVEMSAKSADLKSFIVKQQQIQKKIIAATSAKRSESMAEASSLKRGQKGVSAYRTMK